MLKQLKEEFLKIYKDDSEKSFFSPGRVNLIGEHIDYNGGYVLPMAINFGTYGIIKLRNDTKVRAYSMNFKKVGIKEFDLKNVEYKKEDEWVNYAKGMVDVFTKHNFSLNQGFDILVYGNIPNGSGLSSSASLEVLIGKILIDLNDLKISYEDLAVYAQEAENKFIGVNCGIMDQFIIANAKDNTALYLNTDTLNYEYAKMDLKDYKVVVINSKKKRELVDSAYNERRESCEKGLEIIKQTFDVTNICDLGIKEFEKLTFPEPINKRVEHAVKENIRVKESVKYLEAGDIENFAKQLNASHVSLRDLFEVSCEELDTLVQLSLENGAIGSRMTGAGFGGCIISLVKEDEIEKMMKVVLQKYKEKFNIETEYYVVESSAKVREL